MKQIITAAFLAFIAIGTRAQGQTQDIRISAYPDSVTVAPDAGLDLGSGMTLEAWVYYEPDLGIGNTGPTILARTGNPHQFQLRVERLTRRLEFRLYTSGSLGILFSTSTIPELTWTHVAATYNGSSMTLLINGTCVGSRPHTGAILSAANHLRIGGDQNANYSWSGSIDEARIWNYARSSAEIIGSMYDEVDNLPGQIAAFHFNSDFNDSTGGRVGSPQGNLTLSPTDSPTSDLRVLAPSVAGVGSALQFTLRGAPANAPYFFDNSFAGSTFGLPLFAPLIGMFPLDPPLLNLSYGPSAPGVFVGYMGFTDAQGKALATFHVPAFPYLAGLDLHSAFLYLDNLNPMVLGGISPVAKTRIHDGSAPVITTILPNQGPLAGSWPIAVLGQNFLPGAAVLVRGQLATQVNVLNANLITCLSPPGLNNGSFNLEVQNGDGQSVTSINGYSYVNTLVVTALSPASATAGQSVTINGSGMGLTATVTVNGMPATITSASGMQLVFTMPLGAACHAVVTVSKPDGQSGSLVMNSGPFVSSMTTNQGPYTGGTLCKIFGGHFSPQAQVTLDGNPAIILLATPGYFEFLTPPGLPGPATVLITNPDGCTASSNFSYGL